MSIQIALVTPLQRSFLDKGAEIYVRLDSLFNYLGMFKIIQHYYNFMHYISILVKYLEIFFIKIYELANFK